MTDQEFSRQLREAFRQLDSGAIWRLAEFVDGRALDDASRVALAFGELARGLPDAARGYIDAIANDGTAPSGDIAYVAGFLLAEDDRDEEAANMLEAAFSDSTATHASRLRLRAAEMRLRLEHWRQVQKNLEPLLGPPGTPDTLEAHFLVLEMLLRSKAPREAVIEVASMTDGLMERGFRMREPQNVLGALTLLSDFRVEGIQDRLLETHAELVEGLRTDDMDEIAFLVAEGERRKFGAMIRAAARSYEEVDDPWTMSDPEAVAFQFAHHEEFEAARLVIERSFMPEEIATRPDLWGPLLLACYHAERWERTLELLAEHWDQIAGSKLEANSRLMRAVCHFHSGVVDEALAEFAGLGDDWDVEALPHEAACLPKALASSGHHAEAIGEVTRWMRAERPQEESAHYLNTLFNYATMSGDEEFFGDLLGHVLLRRDEKLAGRIFSLGDFAMKWDRPEMALLAADRLFEMGETGHANYLRTAAMLHPARVNAANAEAALAKLAELADHPDQNLAFEALLERARALVRLGRKSDAYAVVRIAVDANVAPRRHLAWELLARLLEPTDPERAKAARQRARASVNVPGASHETNFIREYERANALEEDDVEGVRRVLHEVRRLAPRSSEIERLERRLAILERARRAG